MLTNFDTYYYWTGICDELNGLDNVLQVYHDPMQFTIEIVTFQLTHVSEFIVLKTLDSERAAVVAALRGHPFVEIELCPHYYQPNILCCRDTQSNKALYNVFEKFNDTDSTF